MVSDRPDPDAILSRIREQEKRTSRGRLEIFLGMCPGVGKTYAMLESAQEDRSEGKQVVIGIVETHKRVETDALVGGLETIPRRQISHRGVTLEEFDLDAALAARPQIILVDELAHTNAPGSRHSKRWQDVRELIEAGINVRTTVNIQHVESLNDVVAQITGVRMRETVPDAVLEKADEVILVDLPPDELIERLQAGKVYFGNQAERAAQGFFSPANLTALRELALRFVASRVGAQVRLYREAAGAQAIWPTQERILVAVGPAPSSATLVRAAKRLATMLGAEWFALFVETPRPISASNRERVSEHLRLAESLGAKTATLEASTVSEGILRFARRENITKLVVGKPVHSHWKNFFHASPVDKLVRESEDINVYVIKGETPAAPGKSEPEVVATSGGPLRNYLIPFLAAGIATATGKILSPLIVLPDLAMVFLLASSCVAFLGSRRAAILMAILSALCFNFFFIPPIYTFDIAPPEFIITFVMLFVVSLTISELTLRSRIERDLARRSEARTAALYRVSAQLAEARDQSAIVRIADAQLSLLFQDPVVISAGDREGNLKASSLGAKEFAVARWVFENNLPAGRGTATLASSSMLHIPLSGPHGCVGVLSIGGHPLRPDQTELLHALTRHIALMLSVEEIDQQRRASERDAESERLRNSVLSAVSHDIRTPLASILGSASSLLEQSDILSEESRRDLLSNITDETDRLNRLVSNLLEIARLEDEAVKLNKVALPMDEIVGSALHAMRRILKDHPVATHIPANLPFVEADELLIQHVLTNLLENAVKHTAAGTPIDIFATPKGNDIEITVADRGPGIPAEEMTRIFDRFHQARGAKGGVGLGLAICKSVVTLHGGVISAHNREGGGAEFRFTLPVATVGALPNEDDEVSTR